MKKDQYLYLIGFVVLMTYLVIRALNVFIVHDEIVTKWSYMIDWNPLPYQGYVDANNQFINSLLGGLFIRLFQSDHILIVRLASLLTFPFYFWAIMEFKSFFKRKAAFYLFLIALLINPLVLEFFALARGYAMSWTFMLWGALMLFKLIKSKNSKYFFFLLTHSLLALFANLSVIIPICLLIAYAVLFILSRKSKQVWIRSGIGLAIWLAPFLYLVNYSFELQKIGKLYLGNAENFYSTSIESLLKLSFQVDSITSLIISSIVLGVIFIQLVKQIVKRKEFFDLSYTFAQLFAFSTLGVVLLQFIFGVNYPENRAAVYLYLLFMPAFAFAVDRTKNNFIAPFLSIVLLIVFITQANITKTKAYSHEYINFNLLKHIPDKVKGIPTACGGRQLAVSKVIYRESNQENHHFFQTSLSKADTLQDYIMCLEEDRADIQKYYRLKDKESDSRMLLYERKKFLDRKKVDQYENEFSTRDEFFNLMPKQSSKAAFIRCTGHINYIDLQHAPTIVYAQSDSADNKFNYGSFTPISAVKKSKDDKLFFDITFTMLDYKDADFMSLYIWNKKKQDMEGKIKIELYEIEF